MDRRELYNKISEMIPVEHPKEKTFKDVLGKALGQFESWISEVDEGEILTKEKEKVINSIKKTNRGILGTIDLVSKGKHAKAAKKMRSNLCAKPLLTESINEGDFFYRMRTNEKKERLQEKTCSIFH